MLPPIPLCFGGGGWMVWCALILADPALWTGRASSLAVSSTCTHCSSSCSHHTSDTGKCGPLSLCSFGCLLRVRIFLKPFPEEMMAKVTSVCLHILPTSEVCDPTWCLHKRILYPTTDYTHTHIKHPTDLSWRRLPCLTSLLVRCPELSPITFISSVTEILQWIAMTKVLRIVRTLKCSKEFTIIWSYDLIALLLQHRWGRLVFLVGEANWRMRLSLLLAGHSQCVCRGSWRWWHRWQTLRCCHSLLSPQSKYLADPAHPATATQSNSTGVVLAHQVSDVSY